MKSSSHLKRHKAVMFIISFIKRDVRWASVQMSQQCLGVRSRQNMAKAKTFPNSPLNLGSFRLQQGLISL